ncbi:hypothetical protein EYF80_022734 [Liparis tanakae]|uniref:Uncharacterized protein n=1 Tax=Liparis tanakae TaxID=230148 RepID=A0A4Z2HML4_9TELE|nr:hypothetical protein EYF80_022734 [Liparis tanakae]
MCLAQRLRSAQDSAFMAGETKSESRTLTALHGSGSCWESLASSARSGYPRLHISLPSAQR